MKNGCVCIRVKRNPFQEQQKLSVNETLTYRYVEFTIMSKQNYSSQHLTHNKPRPSTTPFLRFADWICCCGMHIDGSPRIILEELSRIMKYNAKVSRRLTIRASGISQPSAVTSSEARM